MVRSIGFNPRGTGGHVQYRKLVSRVRSILGIMGKQEGYPGRSISRNRCFHLLFEV